MKAVLVFKASTCSLLFYNKDAAFVKYIQSNPRYSDALQSGLDDDDIVAEILKPLLGSCLAMQHGLRNSYQHLQSGNMNIVCSYLQSLTFIAINGDGQETTGFMKRKLSALQAILKMSLGPAIDCIFDTNRRAAQQKFSSLFETWCRLINDEQCFLIEAIEKLYINQASESVSKKCVDALEDVVTKWNNSAASTETRSTKNDPAVLKIDHAALFAHDKLLALYSKRRKKLSSYDLLLAVVHVLDKYPGPVSMHQASENAEIPSSRRPGAYRRTLSGCTVSSNDKDETTLYLSACSDADEDEADTPKRRVITGCLGADVGARDCCVSPSSKTVQLLSHGSLISTCDFTFAPAAASNAHVEASIACSKEPGSSFEAMSGGNHSAPTGYDSCEASHCRLSNVCSDVEKGPLLPEAAIADILLADGYTDCSSPVPVLPDGTCEVAPPRPDCQSDLAAELYSTLPPLLPDTLALEFANPEVSAVVEEVLGAVRDGTILSSVIVASPLVDSRTHSANEPSNVPIDSNVEPGPELLSAVTCGYIKNGDDNSPEDGAADICTGHAALLTLTSDNADLVFCAPSNNLSPDDKGISKYCVPDRIAGQQRSSNEAAIGSVSSVSSFMSVAADTEERSSPKLLKSPAVNDDAAGESHMPGCSLNTVSYINGTPQESIHALDQSNRDWLEGDTAHLMRAMAQMATDALSTEGSASHSKDQGPVGSSDITANGGADTVGNGYCQHIDAESTNDEASTSQPCEGRQPTAQEQVTPAQHQLFVIERVFVKRDDYYIPKDMYIIPVLPGINLILFTEDLPRSKMVRSLQVSLANLSMLLEPSPTVRLRLGTIGVCVQTTNDEIESVIKGLRDCSLPAAARCASMLAEHWRSIASSSSRRQELIDTLRASLVTGRHLSHEVDQTLGQTLEDLNRAFVLLYCSPGTRSSHIITPLVDSVRSFLTSEIGDFSDFFVARAQRNFTMAAFQSPPFEGLFHFVFVNRTSNYMAAPSLTADDVTGGGSSGAVARLNAFIKNRLWSNVDWIYSQLQHAGCVTSLIWDADFVFSYMLWFEDLTGTPRAVPPQQVLFRAISPVGDFDGRFYRMLTNSLFRDEDVQCCEMFGVHLGLLPEFIILRQCQRLYHYVCHYIPLENCADVI